MVGIPYTLEYEVIRNCKNYVLNNNMGQRSFANGNIDNQLYGLLGEYYTAFHYDQPSPLEKKKGFDGGYDMIIAGKKWDVKTRWLKQENRGFDPTYEITDLFGSQRNYDVDGYIFGVINKRQFLIVGWMEKEEYFEKATLYRKGTQIRNTSYTWKDDNYSLTYSRLNPITTFNTGI